MDRRFRPAPNKRYTTIAAYAVAVVALSAICVALVYYGAEFVRNSAYGMFIAPLRPFGYAFVFAFLLNPVYEFFNQFAYSKISKKSLKKTLVVISTILSALIIIAAIFIVIVPQLIASLQAFYTQINSLTIDPKTQLSQLIDRIPILAPYRDQIIQNISEYLNPANIQQFITNSIGTVVSHTVSVLTSITKELFYILLGFIIGIYLLISKRLFIAQLKKIVYAVAPKRAVLKIIDIAHQANRTFTGFLQGKIVIGVIMGLITYIVMLACGWGYAPLIALAVGISDIIPFIGPYIGWALGGFILLLVNPWQALWFTVYILVVQQINANIISPRILGQRIGLSSFWIIFAVIVMGNAYGFVGMLVGVPIFAIIYTLVHDLIKYLLRRRGFPQSTAEYSGPSTIPVVIAKPGGDPPGPPPEARPDAEAGLTQNLKARGKFVKRFHILGGDKKDDGEEPK